MTIKEQLLKLKENWLLVLLVAVVLGVLLFGGNSGVGSYLPPAVYEKSYGKAMDRVGDMMAPTAAYRGGSLPYYNANFAPEEKTRLITKSGNLYTEVEQGTFNAAEEQIKAVLKSSDAYLLSENVNKYESGWKAYYSGSYSIKVASSKYDAIVTQLKQIGEVRSFNENAQDITAQHKDIKTELAAEKERLKRFEDMFAKADKMEDKIILTDRMYDLERTIKYLEDSLKNVENMVEYSTVYVSLTEKQSGYANIAFVKLSELVSAIVGSVGHLLVLLFWALPWALAVWLGVFVYRKIKKRK